MATANPQLGKSGKYGDLKKRLLFLLGALLVFRIGAHIPVPGIDPVKLAELFQGQQQLQYQRLLQPQALQNVDKHSMQ